MFLLVTIVQVLAAVVLLIVQDEVVVRSVAICTTTIKSSPNTAFIIGRKRIRWNGVVVTALKQQQQQLLPIMMITKIDKAKGLIPKEIFISSSWYSRTITPMSFITKSSGYIFSNNNGIQTTRNSRMICFGIIQNHNCQYSSFRKRSIITSLLSTTTRIQSSSFSSTTPNTTKETNNNNIYFFPIYYNDVYKVQLPKNHRFPMEKYTMVRQRVRTEIVALQQQEQQQEQQKQQQVQSNELTIDDDDNYDDTNNTTDQLYNTIDCNFYISPLASYEQLCTTHDPQYIQRFLNGNITMEEERNVGFPWSVAGVNRSLSSVGGTVAAAESICNKLMLLQQQQQNEQEQASSSPSSSSSILWSAHIAGGTHHAFYDYGEGFSTFSDIAVACNVVLQKHPTIIQNILIIDLDVHQGNGNAVLFHNNNNVFTFSIHCSGNYFSQKQTSNLDIELPIGCTDHTYLATLKYWLDRFRIEMNVVAGQETQSTTTNKTTTTRRPNDTTTTTTTTHNNIPTKFDLIFFQAGVDVLYCDRLGKFELSEHAVRRRNELVYQFAYDTQTPLIITMGGGYPKHNDDWEPIISAHTNVYVQAYMFMLNKQKTTITKTITI